MKKGEIIMKILFVFLFILILSGCGKKQVKTDPVVEAEMKIPVTCIRCRQTAPRISYRRVNQVLVQCTRCQKIFTTLKKGR